MSNAKKKKNKNKKNGFRAQKLGFKEKKKVVARCVRHFWKMVVARWLWAFLKNLRLFDCNIMAGLVYADDTITHTAGKKLEVVEPKLQISADDFNTWCIDNNMGVHYGKTHAFVVGLKHMTSANEGICVTINEHSIESVSVQKHLGMTIDKNLTWEQQIDLVCRNVSRKLTLTKLLSKYVNQSSLKQYYNSYVLPVFDFGCVVWGITTNANLTRLVKLQKRAARMLLKAYFMTLSEQLFKGLNWLPFPQTGSVSYLPHGI